MSSRKDFFLRIARSMSAGDIGRVAAPLVSVIDAPSPEAEAVVSDGLGAYDDASTGVRDWRPLTVLVSSGPASRAQHYRMRRPAQASPDPLRRSSQPCSWVAKSAATAG